MQQTYDISRQVFCISAAKITFFIIYTKQLVRKMGFHAVSENIRNGRNNHIRASPHGRGGFHPVRPWELSPYSPEMEGQNTCYLSMLILPEVGIELCHPLWFIFTGVTFADDDACVVFVSSGEVLHQILDVEGLDGNIRFLVSAHIGCFVVHLLFLLSFISRRWSFRCGDRHPWQWVCQRVVFRQW